MSRPRISVALQRDVRRRAGNCCEYCRFPQQWQEAEFHFDHVLPLCRGGETTASNLAWACVSCSLRKGARTSARDSVTGKQVRLFNPRRDRWADHFTWTNDWHVVGNTAVGRATVAALRMNGTRVVRMRRFLAVAGLFPDDSDVT